MNGIQLSEQTKKAVNEYVNKNQDKISSANDVVNKQRNIDLEKISKNENFKKASEEVSLRSVETLLRKDAVAVLSQENQNKLQEYILQKQKEELDYRAKREKNLIKKKVDAEVKNKETEIAYSRYGYLYKTKADFTPNKFINKYKEFANWYKNLGDTTKNIIKTSLKIFMWICIVLIVFFACRWLINSGIINVANNYKIQ